MPPPRCARCGAPAALRRPRSGQPLCRPCFMGAFEAETLRAVSAGRPALAPGAAVAVAASGGKDSSVLAHVLGRLNGSLRLRLLLLSVDEGIGGYRDVALGAVRRQRGRLPLVLVSHEGLYGWPMDRVAAGLRRGGGGGGHCTVCGVLRRRALERAARALGCAALATGHNADDIAETVLMNFLRGDVARLRRTATEATAEATGEATAEATSETATEATTGDTTEATSETATEATAEATKATAPTETPETATGMDPEATLEVTAGGASRSTSRATMEMSTRIPNEAAGTRSEAAGTPTEATRSHTEAAGSPTEATGTPMKATRTPMKATRTPTEATRTPTEATRSHMEADRSHMEADRSSRETGSPTEATRTPMEATRSHMEADGSSRETGSPTEATRTPMEATRTPTEATGSPMEAIGTPTEATRSHTEAIGTPVEATGTPMEATGTPMEATRSHMEADGSSRETGSPTEATGYPMEATGSPAEPPAPPLGRRQRAREPPSPWPAVPRCKPLRHAYEKEIVLYARFAGLDYASAECVYAPHAHRGHARALLKELEAARASAVAALGHSGRALAVRGDVAAKALRACGRCGFAASQPLCKACGLLASLERGLPRLALGKREPTVAAAADGGTGDLDGHGLGDCEGGGRAGCCGGRGATGLEVNGHGDGDREPGGRGGRCCGGPGGPRSRDQGAGQEVELEVVVGSGGRGQRRCVQGLGRVRGALNVWDF